jgi:4-aminobutyrate aminotransferase-like enzyme
VTYAAMASHRHFSVIGSPQSGHGTSQPTVAVTGSSASTPHPVQPHHPVVIVVSMARC